MSRRVPLIPRQVGVAGIATSELEHSANKSERAATADGAWVLGVSLTAATPKQIEHKRGRTPKSYCVCRVRGAATITEVSMTETHIQLLATADCTVDLLVF